MLLSLIAILHKILITFISPEIGKNRKELGGKWRGKKLHERGKKGKKAFHYFLTVRKTKRLDWNKLKCKCL